MSKTSENNTSEKLK